MRLVLAAFALVVAMLMAASPARTEGRSIIVLDGSGSMWGQIDGRPKLEIAREALARVLSDLPAGAEVGLMAYGHRERGNCADIELVVPPAPGTAPAITEAAAAMRFLGKTPLTEAVRQAAAALRATEDKATVILITDGLETCNADPCALGRDLQATGVDFTAHVVGFGLSEEEGRQVACLAQETGGLYIQANDADALSQALQAVVIDQPAPAPPVAEPPPPPPPAPIPEPETVAENFAPRGYAVAGGPHLPADTAVAWDLRERLPDGSAGEIMQTTYGFRPTSAPPGDYILAARLDTVVTTLPVTVAPAGMTAPEVVFDAAFLALTVTDRPGGPPADGSYFEILSEGEVLDYGYGSAARWYPEGEFILRGVIGEARVEQPLVLTAGTGTTLDLVVAVGRGVVTAAYLPGMRVEGIGHVTEILSGRAAPDGSRDIVDYRYGDEAAFNLPPGDYLARVTVGAARAEAPLTVTALGETRLEIVVNAGVLFAAAPGADLIEVFVAQRDIQGNRRMIRYDYGGESTETLPAGDYGVVATYGEVKVEASATVAAGARSEVTLIQP